MSYFWVIIFTVTVIYLLIVSLFFSMQSYLIYFPSQEMPFTPEDIGLHYESLMIESKDGNPIHAWYIPSDNEGADTLLFCHGNAGNIGDRLESIRVFHELGLSVLIFDYQGYGKSPGKTTELSTYYDAMGAWNYLTEERQVPINRIIVFGRSLGAPIAAHVASKVPVKALIIESGMISVPKLAQSLYPFLPIKWLCRFSYSTEAAIQKVQAPILVIHSPEDKLVPFHHSEYLYDMIKQKKLFLKISGDHNDGFLQSEGRYKKGIKSFLNTISL